MYIVHILNLRPLEWPETNIGLYFLKALKCLWQVCTYWANSTIPFFCCHGYLGLRVMDTEAACYLLHSREHAIYSYIVT